MKDERDTQRMNALDPGAVEAPAVRQFKYRTDPGVATDHDKELLRGVSRARDAREERTESLGDIEPPAPAPSPALPTPVQKVTIVHSQRFPTWLIWVLIGLPIAILVVAMLNARKTTSEHRPAPPATPTTPATATTPPTVATSQQPPSATATIAPAPFPTVTFTAPAAVTTAAPTHTPRPRATTSATAPAPAVTTAPTAATTTHPDTDIVRTPEL